jgi:hypothetical protein
VRDDFVIFLLPTKADFVLLHGFLNRSTAAELGKPGGLGPGPPATGDPRGPQNNANSMTNR